MDNADIRSRVAAYVAAHGTRDGAARLGLSRSATTSLIAGRAHAGTYALAQGNLWRLDLDGVDPSEASVIGREDGDAEGDDAAIYTIGVDVLT